MLPSPPLPWWQRLRLHPRIRRPLLWSRAQSARRFSQILLGTKLSRGELGLLGEFLACRCLRQRGRRVLYCNYRGPNRGEVDIVARHGDVLSFVEVKTRTTTAFGRPADAVTPDKQRLIQRGALAWLRLLGNPPIKFRFDIVEVLLIPGELPQLNIIQNAFQMPDASTAGRSGDAA
ncbi:MAG: YraN family protein [Prosthecobacter sp.]|nr:YraN family protein [Prosthecobacter sp.]